MGQFSQKMGAGPEEGGLDAIHPETVALYRPCRGAIYPF